MMSASMMRATGVLLIVAGGLYGATAANEALRCEHVPFARSPDLAIRYCTAAIESGGLPDAGLAVVLGRRCRGYEGKHDYVRALQDCERAVKLAPTSALAVYRRGSVRFYINDLDGALLDCDRAIRLDPNIAVAYRARASIYNGRGQYDRAIQDNGEALLLKPDAATYYWRGWSYFQKRYYDSAKQDFDEAIRLGSGAWAYYYRGWCYIYTVDYSRAMADFDQAIRLNPNFAWAYGSRAYLHNRRGEYDRAIRDFSQALRLSPDAESYNGRGWTYYHQGAYLLASLDFARASWRVWMPFVLVVGLIYLVVRHWKGGRAESPSEDSDGSPETEDLEPSIESPDVPWEEPVSDPAPAGDSSEDADLGTLIRTAMRDRVAIGLLESLLREAGIPFFVMDQNPAARLEGASAGGWWDIRVPREREAEAREIIQAVEEMK
jgi:Tfp pilus assembly protein PilF